MDIDAAFINTARMLVSGLAHEAQGPLPALSEAEAAVLVIASQIKFVYQATGGDQELFMEAMEDVADIGANMEAARIDFTEGFGSEV